LKKRLESVPELHVSLVVVPLFFGQSKTVTDFIPSALAALSAEYPKRVSITMANSLMGSNIGKGKSIVVPDSCVGDDALVAKAVGVKILKGLNSKNQHPFSNTTKVVIMDHGSPSKCVTESRELLASQVNAMLKLDKDYENLDGNDCQSLLNVFTACMERRDGPKYDFNGDVLSTKITKLADRFPDIEHIVVGLMFLSGGRHAGKDGDIDTMVRAIEEVHPSISVYVTEPLSGSPLLLSQIIKNYAYAVWSTGTNAPE